MIAAPAVVVVATASIWQDLFAFEIPPLEKIARTILVYFAIVIILRLAGKRLLAQMNSLDLVVVLLISNVVQNAIIGQDNSLAGGVLGVIVLVVINDAMDRLAQKFAWVRWVFEGRPTTVIEDGQVDQGEVDRLGLSEHEIALALHAQGADHASEVKEAVIEPGGHLTVELKRDHQPASYGELRAAIDELKRHIDARNG